MEGCKGFEGSGSSSTIVVDVAVLSPGRFAVGLLSDDEAVSEADLSGGAPAV